MPKLRQFTWHDQETGAYAGASQDDKSYTTPPTCPMCGKKTHAWEGQIGQDFMGNDIDGWCWCCYDSQIHTPVEELDESDD